MHRTEPKLLQALVGTYGAVDGREAAVDALSWAWEHWDRLDGVSNQVGAWCAPIQDGDSCIDVVVELDVMLALVRCAVASGASSARPVP